MIALQVHYDLGAIYFQQGCSDPSAYVKAQEHFRKTRELLAKVDEASYAVLAFYLSLFSMFVCLLVGCSNTWYFPYKNNEVHYIT